MLRSVLTKTLRDARRGFAWWSAGLVGLVALMVAVYPSIRDNPELNRLVEDYPEALKAFIAFGGNLDYTSGAGYLGSELYSFMIPLLFLVAAVGSGAGAIAGEEERGTLDLLLASPISRRRLAAEKLGAVAIELAALAVVLWLALWLGVRAVGMEVSGAHLGAATASAFLVALLYGTLAFALGAGTGRRAIAIGVSAAAAVAGYLVNSLAGLVDALEPVRVASPFYHYAASDPLRAGLEVGHVLFLAGATAVTAGAGVLLFERRDLS